MRTLLHFIKQLNILIAVLVCISLTGSAEATIDLNGFTIGGYSQQSGTSSSGTQDSSSGSGAYFSSGNLFGSEEPQSTVPPFSASGTGLTLPETSLPQISQTTQGINSSQMLFGTDTGEYRIRWPVDTNDFITVLINGKQVENEELITYGSDGRTVVISVVAGQNTSRTLKSCTVNYNASRYDASTGQYVLRSFYEAMTETQQGGFSFTIRDELKSDIRIEIQTSSMYPIYVCGIPVTDRNLGCVLGEGNTSVTYSPEERILSLNNAVIRGAVDIQADFPVTIQLTGNSRITGSPKGYGIHAGSALTIVSSGAPASLDVYAESAENSSAVWNDNGGVVIGNGVSVTAVSSGGQSSSFGIRAPSLEVTGSLSATGGAASESSGIRCGSLTAQAGSGISAKGGMSSGGSSSGISAESVRINGGILNAEAGTAAGDAYGIQSPDIVISGGTVSASGDSGAFSSKPGCYGFTPQIRISDPAGNLQGINGADASGYRSRSVVISSSALTVTPAELSLKKGESSVLNASVSAGFSVRWSSSSSAVSVDQFTGRVTAVSAGKALITASAYNESGVQTDTAVCSVTVSDIGAVSASGLRFDQEVVTLNVMDETRTVRYWFTPLRAAEIPLTWTCTDTGGKIIRVEVSEDNQEFTITAAGNGTAVISASAEGGIKEYCRVTVSGIGTDGSCYIDYMDNSGVWYYDRTEGFNMRCTGSENDLLGIYMDGVYVPGPSDRKTNWISSSTPEGETIISFSKEYMSTLSHDKHTVSLSYSGVGSVWKTIYVQSAGDAPRTGDRASAPYVLAFLLSGAGAVLSWKKRKDTANGI